MTDTKTLETFELIEIARAEQKQLLEVVHCAKLLLDEIEGDHRAERANLAIAIEEYSPTVGTFEAVLNRLEFLERVAVQAVMRGPFFGGLTPIAALEVDVYAPELASYIRALDLPPTQMSTAEVGNELGNGVSDRGENAQNA